MYRQQQQQQQQAPHTHHPDKRPPPRHLHQPRYPPPPPHHPHHHHSTHSLPHHCTPPRPRSYASVTSYSSADYEQAPPYGSGPSYGSYGGHPHHHLYDDMPPSSASYFDHGSPAHPPRTFAEPAPSTLSLSPSTSSTMTDTTGGPLVPLASWEDLLGDDSTLVLLSDRDLVPDALFVAMAQMKPCTLTMADRVGCYKTREFGFVGMCCKHCGGQPGFGRYFPNSVRSLAQTTTSQTILKHIGAKCRFCPPDIRQAVLELQRQQAIVEGAAAVTSSNSSVSGGNSNTAAAAAAGGRPRYGSRKIFFQRVWSRLHGTSKTGSIVRSSSSEAETTSNNSGSSSAVATAEDEDDNLTKQTSSSSSSSSDDASNETPSDLDEESSSLCTLEVETTSNGNGSPKRKHRFGALPINKRVKVTSPHHRLHAD